MRKILVAILLVLLAGGADAQIVLINTSNSETATKTWTLTNLNNTPPVVSSGVASGTLTGALEFLSNERFSLTASARYGWSTAGAQASTNEFGAYLSGLSVAGIGAINGAPFGVDSSSVTTDLSDTSFTGTSEMMVLTVSISELNTGSILMLKGINFQIYDDNARTDFLVYDVSADAVVHAEWNDHFQPSGDWSLEDGDMIIIATGADNTSTRWRIDSLSLDATAGGPDTEPPTPSPSAWDSVPSADSPFSISMTATTGADVSGVEYFFDETSGNPGGSDSGWQISSSYTDSGLTPLTEYSYSVMMRDTFGNSGTVSSVEFATTEAAPTARTNGPPNVVFIYADDLGNADISRNASSNSLVHTPNIDRICKGGVYLSNYMTHHVCSPSRAGLITGRHYTEVGAGVETGGTLDNSIPNIAKDFKAAGYTTGCFGKWHNGNPPFADDETMVLVNSKSDIIKDDNILQYLSSQRFDEGVNAYGFDDWAGYYGGGFDYHNRQDPRDVNWWANGVYTGYIEGYNTYLIRDNALNFIDANADKPFFLYVPMEAVHGPYDILNTDLEEMCSIVSSNYPSLAWVHVKELVSPTTGSRIEDVLQMRCSSGAEFDMAALEIELPGYADLIYYTLAYAMDKATGDILDRLEVYGLSTNTIVVFASDNGGTDSGDNYPFSGTKHTLWEGGVHVPAAICWPGTLDANQAPYTPSDNNYTNMTQYFDWYPTLTALAGQPLTATELDGLDLSASLQGRTPARNGFENCYYGLDDSWAAIRNDRWKLHFNRSTTNQKLELYDLHSDIGETTNMQAAYVAERDTLIALLDAWFATDDVTASYMPLTGESIPPYTGPTPFGDILEVTAVQENSISNQNSQGVYVRFSEPSMDDYVHAGDVLVYDIYVADDSDQINGMYCSPSFGPTPRFNTNRGMTTNGVMLVDQILPKGQWVRMMSGMGEIAANSSYASFIVLQNPEPGTYHFYIDNMSVRKKDGSVRGVSWDNESDTRSGFWYLQGGVTYKTVGEALAAPGFPFSAISLNTVDLSTLPDTSEPGLSYSSWAATMGVDIGGYDPAGAGPTNAWPIFMEYGLGSDPTTYTAALSQKTNAPTSGELGTYTFRNLPVDGRNLDYMTMTFDFNREACDVEIIVAESSNLVDWVDSVVLQPPYSDTGILFTNQQVVEVEDNLSGYPVEATRITARSRIALDNASEGFLKLEVRPLVNKPDLPEYLTANAHDGILLEWIGDAENGEYIIERASSGGTFKELVRTESRIYTDTSAAVGQTYEYRVRAVNAAGATIWSNPVSITR